MCNKAVSINPVTEPNRVRAATVREGPMDVVLWEESVLEGSCEVRRWLNSGEQEESCRRKCSHKRQEVLGSSETEWCWAVTKLVPLLVEDRCGVGLGRGQTKGQRYRWFISLNLI